MPKNSKGIIPFVVVCLVIILSLTILVPSMTSPNDKTPYSEIIQNFDEYKVTSYTLDLGTGELFYKVKGDGDEVSKKYNVPNVQLFLKDTENYREEYNEKFPNDPLSLDYKKIVDNSWLFTLIPSILLLLLFGGSLYFMMKQGAGGSKYMQFSKAKIAPEQGKKVTFGDVAGADEEKEELVEVVDFLRNPKKYSSLGARIPKGILLLGPPGTGKTLLAKAVAGEAGCPFFSISGSDFVEMFVGMGASRVRDLFDQARKNSPSIIFIDEIDAVGRRRGAGLGGGHDEREQTLNQLLVEMDGFNEHENIIIIAATNRRDILDPALLRPGRFDRQVMVGYPDVKGREEILKIHTKNKPLGPDVDLKAIAKLTIGFTGADLENLTNEASLLAAKVEKKAITQAEIDEAILKVIAGPEKKTRITTERDNKITAYHEAGHAVAAYYLETQDKVQQVTIIGRGMAAGLTLTRPETDDHHLSKKKMAEDIIMSLGGRVAEVITQDDICTGASGDLKRATEVARAMVTQYGFSEKLGPVVYGGDDEVFIGKDYGHTKTYSDAIAAEIDREIKEIIEDAYKKCIDLLETHRDKLEFVAKYLLKFEKVDEVTFEKLMNGTITESVLNDTVDLEKKDTDAVEESTDTDNNEN